MSEQDQSGAKKLADINRREILIRAARLAGGAALAGTIAACSGEQETSAAMAERLAGVTTRGDVRTAGRFFTDAEFATLSRVSDLIIPATDTPGAVGAAVPETLDALMTHWASAERQGEWRAAVAALRQAAKSSAGRDFIALDEAAQEEFLQSYDAEAFRTENDGYQELKQYIVRAYYMSEIGATQELRFELVPGAWRGCVPFEEIGRTWA